VHFGSHWNHKRLRGTIFQAEKFPNNPQGNTVFEVGVQVSSAIQGNDEVKYKEFPAMKVVSTLYVGSYENVAPAYETIIYFPIK
jgi:effector-binding domain-containing protein